MTAYVHEAHVAVREREARERAARVLLAVDWPSVDWTELHEEERAHYLGQSDRIVDAYLGRLNAEPERAGA